MKERRLYKRHTTRLPSRLEAIMTSDKKKINDLETKDISIGGAFIYTKESSSFPEGTRFIIDLTIPSGSKKELTDVKRFDGMYWNHGAFNPRRYSDSVR